MYTKQLGGNPMIIAGIFCILIICISSSSIGFIYSSGSSCKDETSCKSYTTLDPWVVDKDISNSVTLNRKCTNKYGFINSCKNLTATKSINVGDWNGTLDKDLSGTLVRTCTDVSYCPLISKTKVISTTKLKKYPPGQLTKVDDWSASISNATYGNGKYIVTASSNGWTTPSGILYNSARGSNDMFHSLEKYDQITGLPNNDAAIFEGIKGEWVGIQLPQSILLKAYRIYPRAQFNLSKARAPSEFVLFGSNDGTKWDKIDDRRGANKTPKWTDDPQSFYIDSKVKYDRYRLVATVLGNEDVKASKDCINIEKWEFFEEI